MTAEHAMLGVDLERNTMSVAGRNIRLQAQEAEFLYILALGGVIGYGRMISQIWASDEPVGARNQIKVYATRLRKKLAGTGLRIAAHYGVGYELVHDGPPPSAGLLSALA